MVPRAYSFRKERRLPKKRRHTDWADGLVGKVCRPKLKSPEPKKSHCFYGETGGEENPWRLLGQSTGPMAHHRVILAQTRERAKTSTHVVPRPSHACHDTCETHKQAHTLSSAQTLECKIVSPFPGLCRRLVAVQRSLILNPYPLLTLQLFTLLLW